MEEATNIFLISLLHAAWRHGGGEDGCYFNATIQITSLE